jgi:hypothetical protein
VTPSTRGLVWLPQLVPDLVHRSYRPCALLRFLSHSIIASYFLSHFLYWSGNARCIVILGVFHALIVETNSQSTLPSRYSRRTRSSDFGLGIRRDTARAAAMIAASSPEWSRTNSRRSIATRTNPCSIESLSGGRVLAMAFKGSMASARPSSPSAPRSGASFVPSYLRAPAA